MKNILLQNFYSVISSDHSTQNDESYNCIIRLNAEHPIYNGHFRQIPVAPGVCLTQIIKEVLMEKLQKDLIMTSGDNIKFLAMINPKETPELELSFTLKTLENSVEVSCIYAHNSTTFVKFKGKFSVIQ